jgi:GT2 family glycosyltransferase
MEAGRPTRERQEMMDAATEPLGRVLVIIPTYNEVETLEKIIARVRHATPLAEILVADDNSPDGTGELADRLAQSDGQVHVLHRPGKQGLGVAYLAGFDWGLERGYDVLVEMDADGSHQPEQLPSLLAALDKADMVKGSRWMRGGTVVNWDKKRELLSRGANVWIQAAMDLPVHDATGGYNVYKASILRAIDLHDVASKGYTFQVDMTRRVMEAGGVVAEVPIEFCEREAGVSKMSGGIIKEALMRTAVWGAQRRWQQVCQLGAHVAEWAAPLTNKVKSAHGGESADRAA